MPHLPRSNINYNIFSKPSYSLLSPLQLQPLPTPPLIPPRHQEPHTTNPTKDNAHPTRRRDLPQINHGKLKRRAWHSNESRAQRTRRFNHE